MSLPKSKTPNKCQLQIPAICSITDDSDDQTSNNTFFGLEHGFFTFAP